ncbi:MAG: c-type cytochrome [Spirochaetales bacterium]|nr:c-type cytochrome [Spirochaetales bacterium]
MLNGLYDFFSTLGFGDPLHPPVTHLPIGLAAGAFVFVLIAVIFRKKNLEITARHVSILAFIFAFPAILLGTLDWIHYYHAVLFTPFTVKITLASVLLIELAVGIILGNKIKLSRFVMTLLSSVGFVAVIGLGWFGSGVMYGRGIDMSRTGQAQSPAPVVSASPSSVPAKPSAAGEALFAGYCASCHPGGGNVIRPDLTIKISRTLSDESTFLGFIRDPRLPSGQAGAMPSFPADVLPDKSAGDLYDYLIYMNAHGWK